LIKNANRSRLNLYYVFEADKAAHPMPTAAAERIRQKIFESFSKNIKPKENPVPPY